MIKIEKKCWKEYFDDIVSGKKKFDFRLNDFNINEGDILIFKEWNENKNEYTGRFTEKKVTYVGKFDLKNSFNKLDDYLEKGIQIISLE